jgi:hypothetical protein
MKTVLDIEIGKCFTLFENGNVSSFIRINTKDHEGRNARCLMSTDPTYDKGEYYFIQLDLEVVPTLR